MATVFIPAQLVEMTAGQSRIQISGKSVRDLVNQLEAQFPGIKARLCDRDELSPSLQVSVDDIFSTRGLLTKVGPDSEVHFLPAIGGG